MDIKVEKAKLLEQYPDCEAVFASVAWLKWKDGQTPGKRALAEASYAEDVALALQLFLN